jgi:hypothetical protein
MYSTPSAAVPEVLGSSDGVAYENGSNVRSHAGSGVIPSTPTTSRLADHHSWGNPLSSGPAQAMPLANAASMYQTQFFERTLGPGEDGYAPPTAASLPISPTAATAANRVSETVSMIAMQPTVNGAVPLYPFPGSLRRMISLDNHLRNHGHRCRRELHKSSSC